MKIVRIIARLNVGGPARHVIWLTRSLESDEFQSVLVAGSVPAGEQDMAWLARQEGVVPELVPELSRELSLADAVALLKIFRILRRERPEIIHTHTAKAGTVGRTAAFLYRWLTPGTLVGRPRRVTVVHTFHGHVFHSYYGKWRTRLFLAIERLLARFVTDRIIVISPAQLDEIKRRFRIGRPHQFSVVPLGIELPGGSSERGRSELRAELGIRAEQVLVGFVGRLTEIKNLSMFLAIARLCSNDRRPGSPDIHFVIAGDGHLREQLRAEASDLVEAGILEFIGNREDIGEVYRSLDIVALTSLNEGTPLSLIEAMAWQVSIISTAVGGVVDLLGDPIETADEGYTVHERGIGAVSGDEKGFTAGLSRLAADADLRGRLAEAGRRYAEKNYGRERLSLDIMNVYRTLVGPR
jgi:glycosyltransferase involved in cell wall biosynthesis